MGYIIQIVLNFFFHRRQFLNVDPDGMPLKTGVTCIQRVDSNPDNLKYLLTVIQHAHSYFCLGVHVPPGVSIWGYMFIFEGTHILELFFIVKE